MKLRKMPYWSNGERKLSDKFYAVFMDYSDVLRRLPLFEDRKSSDEIARRIDKMNSLRAAGDTLPPEMARYVETMPPIIRNRLADWGILSMTRAAAGKALVDHLADFKASLLAKGGTQRHADLVVSRAEKTFGDCGFKFWSEISASKILAHLADLRKDRIDADGARIRGISAQTFNFYLQAVKQFARWMVRDGRASESPLVHLQGVNVRTDRRRDRRALSADEMRWLLDITANGWIEQTDTDPVEHPAIERRRIKPDARAMLYRLAVETGLRAGELRSLTRGSFNFGDKPSVTIEASYAKNRRRDTLPLKPDTAALLSDHLASKMPHVQAFAVPPRTDVSKMFHADLAEAR